MTGSFKQIALRISCIRNFQILDDIDDLRQNTIVQRCPRGIALDKKECGGTISETEKTRFLHQRDDGSASVGT
jgi:hypothetical protein